MIPRAATALSIALLLWTLPGRVAQAEYYLGNLEEIPVDRLLANLERALKEHPDDAHRHYLLARVHTIAYAQEVPRLQVSTETGDPNFLDGASDTFLPPAAIEPPSSPERETVRNQHLDQAIKLYRRAVQLDPQALPARVGLGWALMKAGNSRAATTELREAFNLAWNHEKDLKGYEYGRSVTVEVGRYLLELLDPESDARELRKIRKRIRKIEAKPQWITPILIPLAPHLAFDDLIAPIPHVEFDLGGDGHIRRWEWITPNAAWLVHDPEQRGNITSGRQLIGATTFWIFWKDGYEALQSMDDNADGWLGGAELEGLALWRDANSNGISETGEVRPLSAWNIEGLACTGTPVNPTLTSNPRGVRLTDGSSLPSYDWKPKGERLD